MGFCKSNVAIQLKISIPNSHRKSSRKVFAVAHLGLLCNCSDIDHSFKNDYRYDSSSNNTFMEGAAMPVNVETYRNDFANRDAPFDPKAFDKYLDERLGKPAKGGSDPKQTATQSFETDLNNFVTVYQKNSSGNASSSADMQKLGNSFVNLVKYYTQFVKPGATPKEAAEWAIGQITSRIGNGLAPAQAKEAGEAVKKYFAANSKEFVGIANSTINNKQGYENNLNAFVSWLGKNIDVKGNSVRDLVGEDADRFKQLVKTYMGEHPGSTVEQAVEAVLEQAVGRLGSQFKGGDLTKAKEMLVNYFKSDKGHEVVGNLARGAAGEQGASRNASSIANLFAEHSSSNSTWSQADLNSLVANFDALVQHYTTNVNPKATPEEAFKWAVEQIKQSASDPAVAKAIETYFSVSQGQGTYFAGAAKDIVSAKQGLEGNLNGLVSSLAGKIGSGSGTPSELSGEDQKKFKQLVSYYLNYVNPAGSSADAAAWAVKQIVGRMGVTTTDPSKAADITKAVSSYFDSDAGKKLVKDAVSGVETGRQNFDNDLNFLVSAYKNLIDLKGKTVADLTGEALNKFNALKEYYKTVVNPGASDGEANVWAQGQVTNRLGGAYSNSVDGASAVAILTNKYNPPNEKK